ncbi:uncharacterized protein CCOS01_08453 [Colletotrichum costaricense]|uniref:Uncharacterized protein n=1 Tax=Colletotrichum costaricense TaxID=1209916 RepID=A0AAI9YWG9_9PEZI|nr:uncharacterized protein CCOS01_08453 [Colletotrichum costaricense]KAK1526035.1 hypothetical protein CCOS01_08453 [Colletotrichum costaricense]
MQANEEPSQAMSPNAHLQQRVPMISSDQCSPDNTHEWTLLSPEAEIMASEISPISPHENHGTNLDTHQHEDLSILGAGIRRKPISVTTHPSAQQTPEGPDEGPQPTSASAERLDEAKRATETLKPIWKIWALEIACIVLSTILIGDTHKKKCSSQKKQQEARLLRKQSEISCIPEISLSQQSASPVIKLAS